MGKIIKIFVLCWVVLIGGFLCYGLLTGKNKDSAIQHIQAISGGTTFVVERFVPDTLPVLVKSGRLGAFYSCLKSYRFINSRKPSKPTDGKGERVILKLQDNTRLDVRINAMEGYSFTLDLYDENDSRYAASSIYAINCDIMLLSKPDSDMYCEDKVLGNKIRPVCTYRPQQPPSQNSLKG